MAKSGAIKLWLVDRGARSDFYWGEGTMYGVGCYLQEYFNQICQHPSSPFVNAVFSWTMGVVADHDLVVYFLASPKRSIIQGRYNQNVQHGSGGTYLTSAGMISEIYLSEMEGDRNYTRLVANIAFHEMLHNKLDAPQKKSVTDIHSLGGGGLAAAKVNAGARPTKREIELMAQALDKKVPQYTADM